MAVGVINYGMGNVHSVAKAFEYIGADVRVINDVSALIDNKDISHLVLPGVGAFGLGVEELKKRGFYDSLPTIIRSRKTPFLGICLGMQLLFESSEEAPGVRGLAVFSGEIKKFSFSSGELKVPHMGWNNVRICGEKIFAGINEDSFFYFCHSYYVPMEFSRDLLGGICNYSIDFCAAIEKNRDRLWAVQFHPEKSQKAGLKVMENFLNEGGEQ